MKSLKDCINESRVNEASIPTKIKKLTVDVMPGDIDGEDGWIIGDSWDFDDNSTEKIFDETLKDILRVFKRVKCGDIITKPISMKEAYDMLIDNGEEPEGTMRFAYVSGDSEPWVYTDLLLRY